MLKLNLGVDIMFSHGEIRYSVARVSDCSFPVYILKRIMQDPDNFSREFFTGLTMNTDNLVNIQNMMNL